MRKTSGKELTMLSTLRQWILTITATALICAVAKALTPGGAGKKVMGVVCGFAMMAALLSVTGDVDAGGIGAYMDRYRREAEAYAGEASEAGARQTRFIIEERCEAYILDKAASMGVSLRSVSVTAKWSDEGFWYPVKAMLEGDESGELSRTIEAELGISRENQVWSTEDGH